MIELRENLWKSSTPKVDVGSHTESSPLTWRQSMTNMTNRSKIEPAPPHVDRSNSKLQTNGPRPPSSLPPEGRSGTQLGDAKSQTKSLALSPTPSQAQSQGLRSLTPSQALSMWHARAQSQAQSRAQSQAEPLTLRPLTPSKALSVWHARARSKAESRAQAQAQAKEPFIPSYFSTTDAAVITRADGDSYLVDVSEKEREASVDSVPLVGPTQWRHLARMLLTAHTCFSKMVTSWRYCPT